MSGLKRGEKHSLRPVHVSVGNVNVDILFYVDKIPGPDESIYARDLNISPGGAALNYAVAATYYGHYVYLVASASNHVLVQKLLEEVKEIGVDTRYVKVVDEQPGVVAVFVAEKGERHMVKFRGANEFLTLNDIPRNLVKDASVVHLASVAPDIVEGLGTVAKSHGAIVTYDPGLYALEVPEEIVKLSGKINVLYLNKSEARRMGVSNVLQALHRGVDMVVVKRGGEGAVVVTGGMRVLRGYSEPIRRVVNATGAGDAFDAFFNAAYVDWGDPLKALLYALAAGALKTYCRGSTLCWDRHLFAKQLEKTTVEDQGRVDESRIGDFI
ncbi:MAG: carbohydrate kinase family protein [Thermogladius sp.]